MIKSNNKPARCYLFIAITLLSLFCGGCTKRQDDAVIIGETPQGTPIVELDSYQIEWEKPVDSDCFSGIAYDSDKSILYVRFKQSDVAYRYLDFPQDEWIKFKGSDSLGKWYNERIKGKYKCQKISE